MVYESRLISRFVEGSDLVAFIMFMVPDRSVFDLVCDRRDFVS